MEKARKGIKKGVKTPLKIDFKKDFKFKGFDWLKVKIVGIVSL